MNTGWAWGRQEIRGRVRQLLKDERDIFPSSKRLERALRTCGLMVSDGTIRDAVGQAELEKLQLRRINAWSEEKFLFELRSGTFSRLPEKVEKAVHERLKNIIMEHMRNDGGGLGCIDALGFSAGGWRKQFKRFPELEKVLKTMGISRKEFLREASSRYNEKLSMMME